ncbi:coiled-coil domain-containing protein [Pararhodobacter zhoushanensis]|uniref:Uncharacterized protein n=1 Tax=Pararhodobacter zhoushanensis TaxID=2479545 RepID=A0ABT3H290_9RHOB|nr:hypothetical protein [Pararhodobacter zhoushanensis]MCW1933919.1 hypothetical protein [Pararhodobacter zhoushanensis]
MKRTRSDTPTSAQPAVFFLDTPGRATLTRICDALGPGTRQATSLDGALDKDGPVLVVTLNPVDSLALALSTNQDTAQACQDWLATRRDLAARLRKARRRLTLIDLSSLAQPEATALWSEIAHRCGLGGPAAAPAIDPPALPDAVFRAAAQALLQSDETVTALIDELAACTLAPSTPTDTLNTVVSALTQQRALEAQIRHLQATVARQTEADRSIRDSHDQARSEIGQLKKDSAGQRAALERAREEQRQSAADLEGKSRALGDAMAQSDLLTQQLLQLETALVQASRDSDQARDRVTALEKALAQHRKELTLHAERDQQLQADAARHRAQVTALTDRLADRLMLKATNEALERALVEAQDSERRRIALLSAQLLADSAAAQVSADALAATQADRDSLRDRCRELSDELTRVYGSASWRVTGLARAARHHLGPKSPDAKG